MVMQESATLKKGQWAVPDVEIEEIDDVAADEAVELVAEGPGHDQGQGDLHERVRRRAS